ncbi:MAG: TIGR03663 family protein, partial [Chloroflexi bacterium]
MTVQSESVQKKFSLDTPVSALFSLNWELVLYGVILALAIATRLYDLGARVMSHDESLHTLYSWNLYAGKGYQHDPLMHGPFLFHITALMYFLFGDNDFTARLGAALLGSVLVVLPYWFRPWLGRLGALAASFMILISPGMLYYSRYIRHDIFVSVWTVLMVLAFFQFMRTRGVRWLYVGAIAVGLMQSTKEISYIHGFIGVTFIGAAWLWEVLPTARRRVLNYALLAVSVVLLALAFYGAAQPAQVVPEGQEAGFYLWDHVDLMVMIAGLALGWLVIQLAVDREQQPVLGFIRSLPAHWSDIAKAALAAIIIFVLLHTTFFTNIGGLYTGTIGEVAYWLEQHGVQRGGQPWYYYLFLVPMYEFLPIFVGGIGALVYIIRRKFPAHAADPLPVEPQAAETPAKRSRKHQAETTPSQFAGGLWPSDGGTFAAFVIYWAFIAFVIYSWAGEKMPWLTIHMTLPAIFVAGHVIQTVLGNFNWQAARKNGGLLLGGALLLMPAALLAIITADPFRSQSLQAMNDTS